MTTMCGCGNPTPQPGKGRPPRWCRECMPFNSATDPAAYRKRRKELVERDGTHQPEHPTAERPTTCPSYITECGCGRVFCGYSKGQPYKFCAPCRKELGYEGIKGHGDCRWCGRRFPHGGKDPKCCSRPCWSSWRKYNNGKTRSELYKPCKDCGGDLPRTTQKRYCNGCDKKRELAAKKRQLERERERRKRKPLWKIDRCYKCGTAIQVKIRRQQCGDCKAKSKKAQNRRISELGKAKKRKAKIRRRFDPLEVFERDGWVCQRCHTKLDPAARGDNSDPLSPELDHIDPLGSGFGAHATFNAQTLCRRCNAEKLDNPPNVDQLTLA